jgi:biotin transport system ATP-binding protein
MPPVGTTPSPDAAFLHIRDVTLQRGVNTIFSDLTLNLTERRIGLIGDNGAGKSSLFRMLCGLDIPQSGNVTVRGLEAHSVSRKRPGLVGMMFQNPDEQIIFPTVAEELALGLSPSGLTRRDAIAQARVFLETRNRAHWADRAIGGLSHGQRQHVCWLALMIASPELLLLDEPFASLDQPGQALLGMDIAKASQQVIVSTHLLEHVRPFERVLWLEHGQVRADGPGEEVCAAYQADVVARIAAQALSYQ